MRPAAEEGCPTEDLLAKAQAGDAEAFIRLIEQHKQSLYKVARGFFTEPMDIEDAVSETVLSCWEYLNQLRKPSYFKTWLIRVLINHCIDVKRQRERLVSMDKLPEVPVQNPDPGNLHFESLVNCLPPDYRPVLILFYGEGFSVREIAVLLHLPTGTVSSRLKRGRERLAAVLKGKECV